MLLSFGQVHVTMLRLVMRTSSIFNSQYVATRCNRLASFHTASLRKVLRIFWPQKISNDQLLRQTKQEDIRTIITRRRWRWIGHVMRKANGNIARVAVHWTPEGKRSRGRPKTTWRRTVEKELRELNYSWSTIEKLAKDRQGWKDFVAALCATQA